MHGKNFISTSRLWLAITALLVVFSCAKEPVENPTMMAQEQVSRPNVTSEVSVAFNILDPDARPATRTMTEGNETIGDGWLNDTESYERVVNRLHLFAVKVENGVETEVEEVVAVNLVPGDFTSTGIRCGHTFKLSSGIKRFYVGANMTEAQISAFKEHKPLTAESHEKALASVMENGMNKEGEGTNILMFSRPASDNDASETTTDIDITGRETLSLTAQLKRAVAKVLVTAKSNTAGYIVYKADSNGVPLNEEGGWFCINTGVNGESGQFILNNTNKSTFVNEHFDPTGINPFPEDPNYNLSEWVTVDSDINKIRNLDMSALYNNFEFYGQDEVKALLAADSGYSYPIKLHDSNRMSKDAANRYKEGIYCLENTVYDDLLEANASLRDAAAWETGTHVWLKLRFLPKECERAASAHSAEDIADARKSTALGISGVDNYTFWTREVDNRICYYNYWGKERYKETYNLTDNDFKEYPGGWVYFRTFIEGGANEDGDNVLSYTNDSSWGIRRNDYCIITINGISQWGREEYIKVKSQTTDWTLIGQSTVTVKPKKTTQR